jgi:hypothetical protein
MNADGERVACVPLQDTAVTPEVASASTPLTLIEEVLSAIVDPLAGELTLRVGGVLSSRTVAEAVELFPAASMTVPGTAKFAASTVIVCGIGQLTMGDIDGVHANETVTSVVFHPDWFGAGEEDTAIEGGVNSTFSVTLVEAVWPELLTAVP